MCQTPNLNFFPGRGDGGARRNAGDKRGQAGAGSRRGAAGGLRAWASVKLPAPESPPAWAHSGRLFPRLGFGRQPCLSLPGVPSMRQSSEDQLVLLLAARLVSESGRGGSTDPTPTPSPALRSPNLRCKAQLGWPPFCKENRDCLQLPKSV